MTINEVLLSLDGVEATYNHAIRALSGVSLTVRTGEIVALLGANGAGKTTALKALSGLLPAERGQIAAGSIVYDGEDVIRRSPAELVRAGLVQVLEGRHCFRSLTVEDNLIVGSQVRGLGRAALHSELERIYALFPRLRDRRRTPAGLTSGGEQQMTAIGRALMARPRLLVLDEPSMGLAPLVVESIFAALKRLNREEGLSILVAEQNSTVALRHADHASVLETGRTVLDGPAAELRERDDIKAFYLGFGVGSPAIEAAATAA
jgi:branched-chain amino acid transport system ATP-binding protein